MSETIIIGYSLLATTSGSLPSFLLVIRSILYYVPDCFKQKYFLMQIASSNMQISTIVPIVLEFCILNKGSPLFASVAMLFDWVNSGC